MPATASHLCRLGTQSVFFAFACPNYFKRFPTFFHEPASLLNHFVYHLVVVVRIVVKKNQFSHIGVEGERNTRTQRTVSPPDMMFVFLVRILRVQDQNVASLEKRYQGGSLCYSALLCLLGTQQFGFNGMQLKCVVWLVVRQVRDRSGRGVRR